MKNNNGNQENRFGKILKIKVRVKPIFSIVKSFREGFGNSFFKQRSKSYTLKIDAQTMISQNLTITISRSKK